MLSECSLFLMLLTRMKKQHCVRLYCCHVVKSSDGNRDIIVFRCVREQKTEQRRGSSTQPGLLFYKKKKLFSIKASAGPTALIAFENHPHFGQLENRLLCGSIFLWRKK